MLHTLYIANYSHERADVDSKSFYRVWIDDDPHHVPRPPSHAHVWHRREWGSAELVFRALGELRRLRDYRELTDADIQSIVQANYPCST